ncbi:hypothetical protein [Celeribacter litoreus]|uniref:hypothetical protein n=1 Tax=Celeribacter litoreus TaxID=2876714 RepID=UPI001CCC8CFE|nr:hypothetical protein [Celeribacter litoreus]MCA0044661.1 hypothetical protein [Celeribacter litoreus]
MKKIISILAISATIAASGCAKPPSKIAPVAVSSSEYSGMSCQKLNAELRETTDELAALEKKQRDKVAGDAIVVFLILVPPSSMAGDYEAEISLKKGEVAAIERAMDKRGC